MRALMIALLLALATAVPVFADGDDGGGFRPTSDTAVTTDVGGPQSWAP